MSVSLTSSQCRVKRFSRQLERRILRSVLARNTPSVVALGGGALWMLK